MALGTLTYGGAVSAHTTGIHDNCTKLNQKWPHGVGTSKARDKTSGEPVRNFTKNTRAYWRAENHNGTLDRDNDRIACELTKLRLGQQTKPPRHCLSPARKVSTGGRW